MLLSGIFSASNTIHVCIQLPTSQVALKIQKYGQIVVLSVYILLIMLGWFIFHTLSVPETDEAVIANIDDDLYELLWQEFAFLALFLITTISCLYF